MNVENTATDNAHVEAQFGVVNGDATVHSHDNTYYINPTDPPERRLEVAVNHLRGRSSARFAEQILADLVREGYGNTKTHYYYALALLSGRSMNELDDKVHDAYTTCLRQARESTPDQWRDALDVVALLLDGAFTQGLDRERDDRFVAALPATFGRLPGERKTEITTHLELLLGGVVQDHLAAEEIQRVAAERMSGDRRGRAWMFFEAVPAPPRAGEPARILVPRETRTRAALGGVAVLVGIVIALSGARNLALSLASLILVSVALAVIVRTGYDLALSARRRRDMDREYGFAEPLRPVSPGHWVRTDFVEGVHDLVDKRFRDVQRRFPDLLPNAVGDWPTDTAGIRNTLKRRFVDRYGNSRVTPAEINWLIRWHARQVGAQWREGKLFAYQVTLATPPRTITLFRAGIAVGAISVIGLMVSGALAALGGIVLAAGAFFAVRDTTTIRVARQRDLDEKQREVRLFEQEEREFRRWVAFLEQRPTDEEMAQWLELDRAYLRATAVQRYGLSSRDLFNSVVVAKGAPKARRARVIYGPERYTMYEVMIFLLTDSGVRFVQVRLNFLNGVCRNEERSVFHYDKVASARIAEQGVRADDPASAEPPQPDSGLTSDVVELAAVTRGLRGREFRLTLVSGVDVAVFREEFGEQSGSVAENAEYLQRLALDTAGVTGALHILESVAADGRDWIDREKQRRRRRSREWAHTDPAAQAFTPTGRSSGNAN
ncbi:hypothetical protein [Actinokineospora enzanensis]|uniref:hypothetical protein n=1 Tax=Actinokineospora enzanensis TaxID=155975 RepID=UPI000363E954|nr:hypothetical protein [Actinokineospora enzanensis]